ncbi:hypothetical protein K3495_g7468 [Podosphaera aphanis]|nr:hypothetical protein K3495_g7468 [Podosphaera aphanis]
MDPEKVKAILEWEPPTSKRQLQRFLGFANFYRRFIRNFSGLTRPLHGLTKKNAVWAWTPSCVSAFENLREAFSKAPSLAVFDWSKRTVVEVDASNWACGGTFSQWVGSELKPVAYFSSKHSAQECNYDIYDKELLSVIKSLEEWRLELEGLQSQFDILTDHQNLQSFQTTKDLNQRQMRWVEFLSRFNFQLIYRPGLVNTRADALSRRPQDAPKDILDDRLSTMRTALIPASKFHHSFASLGSINLYKIDVSKPINDLISDSYNKSLIMQEIISDLSDATIRCWRLSLVRLLKIAFNECQLVAGRVYYRERLVIPLDDEEIQLQVLHRAHHSGAAGHPGRERTIDLVNRSYWWPDMTIAAKKFYKDYLLCTKTKTPRRAPTGLLKPLPLPVKPWSNISMDYITPLPECEVRHRKFRHIAVVVDRLAKIRHFLPTEILSAEELAENFVEKI